MPGGYESLLAIARDSDPGRGLVVISDLRRMSLPPAITEETMIIGDRLLLVGRPLTGYLRAAGAIDIVTAVKERPVVLYAWVPEDRFSIVSAKRLGKLAPSAVMLGVCLATDPTVGQTTAQREKLPGIQYYDIRGPGSPLAVSLSLNRASLVYLIDRAGQIVDVNGLVDTGAKLSRAIR